MSAALFAVGYVIMMGITAGIYLVMGRIHDREPPNHLLMTAGLLWPFFLPFACVAWIAARRV